MKKRNPLALLGGVGLGAGLMYLLDPEGGRRRRALARDKAVHGLKVGGTALRKTSIDVGNRTRGLVSEAGSRLRKGDTDAQVLEARVRSRLGRHVSHPSAIQVQCEEDRVILSGPVLASEVDELLHKVKKVKGVHEVENCLEVRENAEGMPAERSNGRFSLPAVNKRNAALGLGGVGALAGLGLLARSVRSRKAGPQLQR